MPPEGPLPVLVFDGDCNFCRFWVERWRSATGERVAYRPFQAVAGDYPAISRQAFETAVQFIEPGGEGGPPEGRISTGADAVFRALEFGSGPVRWLGAVLSRLPGALALSRLVYRFVARRRTGLGRVTRWFWGRAVGRPTYFFSRWLFLRLLGLTFFFAFLSLLVQIRGLAGARGVLPAGRFLEAVRGQAGPERYRLFPTLFWLGSSDAALVAGCVAGLCCSVLIVAGWWPALSLLGAWALYLSLVVIGQTFLAFQWDALLLETAFLAVFLVPPFAARPALRGDSFSARLSRWLLLWLLFRLMFESGAVKLASGDPAWRNLTALQSHFETQPLPLPAAWWAHRAPLPVQKAATLLLFAIELGAPFCLFFPRRIRQGGFFALVGLQGLIAATGNYAFFNFLTASLCVLMLDDQSWPRRWRRWAGLGGGFPDVFAESTDPARPLRPVQTLPASRAGWPAAVVLPVAGLSFLLSGMALASSVRTARFPAWLETLSQWAAPFRSANAYGLFAVMTTERREIVVEGSDDGEHWREYEFRWKPGDVDRMPPIVAPHQPRLDWQMWFAALGNASQNPWFLNFLARLLEGSPEVLGLLGKNPFPDAPPRYVRAVLYDYHFASGANGLAWWRRERLGLYCPALSLDS